MHNSARLVSETEEQWRDEHAGDPPPWKWSDMRSIAFAVRVWVWPWCIDAGRDENQFAGSRWVNFGPLELSVYYNIGEKAAAERVDRGYL